MPKRATSLYAHIPTFAYCVGAIDVHTTNPCIPCEHAVTPSVASAHSVQVVKNPVTLHLPTGCRKVGTSFSSDKLVDMEDYALDEPVVVVIGAMAHGKVCGWG